MRPPRFDTAQLSLVRTPFDDDNFLFELKHDGFRALAHIWDGNCELISRKRNAYKSFQDLRDNLAKLKVKNAVIDGELVCLDSEGRSIFNELLFRRGSPIFYAFDLLYLNGRDLRQLPLIARKEELRRLIEKSALRMSSAASTSRVAAWICSTKSCAGILKVLSRSGKAHLTLRSAVG
jgi:bifunctional non-homologous end joining protein LigD